MKLSLATKIFLGFFVLLGTFALLASWSVREIRVIADDLRTIRDGHLALARLAAQLETHQENRIRDLEAGLMDPDLKSRDLILRVASAYYPDMIRASVEEARTVCAVQIENALRHGAVESDAHVRFYRNIVQRFDRAAEHNEVADELTRQARKRLEQNEPVTDLIERTAQLKPTMRLEAFQLTKYITDETDQAVRRAEADEPTAILRVAILTGVAILVGLILSFLSARSLAPIGRLVRYARAISRGDYEQEVDVAGQYELQALAEELQRMARSRKERETALDRQAGELEVAYKRVAELKRYHESVVRSLRTAILVTDRELLVTSLNRAAETHWNVSADVRGKNVEDTALGAALIRDVGPLHRFLERAQTIDVAAIELGDKRADVTIAPFQNDRGDVLGLVLALEDVTEAVRTKEALIRSERLAAIGRMSAHVTHEIRNPLSSIGLNAEMLQDLVHEEDASSLCKAIVREVDRLSAITDEYLRFARLPRPVLDETNAGELLSAIASFMRRDVEAAKVTLELSIEPDLPAIHLDADQMRQAILNLVRNAKESMPQGGRIVLSARREGSSVVISVKDSGAGIPKESLERIFDPFFSTKLTGTGLGLALTQQIVAEHGGQLRVESAVGVGSEFLLAMPIAPHGSAGSAPVSGMIFENSDPPIVGRLEAVETTGAKGRAAG